MSKTENGFMLRGKVSDIQTQQTKKGKTMYTYFVFTGRNVERVRSMTNGLKLGDNFHSFVSIKPYTSNKTGAMGLEIWEGDRVAA